MPIVDIEPVGANTEEVAAARTQALADALGAALGSAPGQTWVRMRPLPHAAYAENGAALLPDALPVFVTIRKAHPPSGAALEREVRSVTEAVARSLGRPATLVHVEYAPPAAGRQAFGGVLVE